MTDCITVDRRPGNALRGGEKLIIYDDYNSRFGGKVRIIKDTDHVLLSNKSQICWEHLIVNNKVSSITETQRRKRLGEYEKNN